VSAKGAENRRHDEGRIEIAGDVPWQFGSDSVPVEKRFAFPETM